MKEGVYHKLFTFLTDKNIKIFFVSTLTIIKKKFGEKFTTPMDSYFNTGGSKGWYLENKSNIFYLALAGYEFDFDEHWIAKSIWLDYDDVGQQSVKGYFWNHVGASNQINMTIYLLAIRRT